MALVLAYLFVLLLFNQHAAARAGLYPRLPARGAVLIVMLVGSPNSLLARLISCPPLRYLGRISYSLYLFHLLIRNVVYNYMPNDSVYLTAAVHDRSPASRSLPLSWRLIESADAQAPPSPRTPPPPCLRSKALFPVAAGRLPGKVPFGLVADNITAPCRPS